MCGTNVTEEGPIEEVVQPRLKAKMIFVLPEGGVLLEDIEKDLLGQALERTGGNRTRAGKLLGLPRDQIRYRMEKYGLE